MKMVTVPRNVRTASPSVRDQSVGVWMTIMTAIMITIEEEPVREVRKLTTLEVPKNKKMVEFAK